MTSTQMNVQYLKSNTRHRKINVANSRVKKLLFLFQRDDVTKRLIKMGLLNHQGHKFGCGCEFCGGAG